MADLLVQQAVNGISTGMIYALVALGLTLIFGVMHVINFAHGEVFMMGAFVTVVAGQGLLGLPYPLAVLLAVAAMAIAGWVIDLAAVRPLLNRAEGQTDVLLSTFAVSLLLADTVLASHGPAPAFAPGWEGSLTIGSLTIAAQRVLVVAVGVGLVVLLEMVLRRTDFGRHLRAVAQDRFAARAVGIDVERVGSATFVAASACAGLAGALVAPVTMFSPGMGHQVIIMAFVVVVAGGMGSVTGAVVCGVALGVFESLASVFIPQSMASVTVFALLLVLLLVRPQGLFGQRR